MYRHVKLRTSVNTNPVVIRALVAHLKNAKLIESKEGKSGGLRLLRPPSQISLQEIYSAVNENKGVLALSKRKEYKLCPVSCGMKKVLPKIFEGVNRAVEKSLKGKTLENVMNDFE